MDWLSGRNAVSGVARGAAQPGVVRWSAHVLFWLVYLAVRTAAAAADPPADISQFPYFANRALVVFSYFVLTGILLAVVAGVAANKLSAARNVALVLCALALAPLAQWNEQIWPQVLGGEEPASFPFIIYLFQFGWALPLWGLMQALLGYHFESLAQARAVARAQSLAYDAQLRMLHYQINPHFLFNTLNAISTLVLEGRNAQAEAMLMRLAGFLRYSLDRNPLELSNLADEIEAQRKYLEIERTRFDEKLQVHFDIDEALSGARLPSLLLQPVLENAVKYAISPSANGGSISVSAGRDGDVLRIAIEDDGPGLLQGGQSRQGVGLANARERLELIYGARAGLTVANREPRGCRVEIWMPLEVDCAERTVARAAS